MSGVSLPQSLSLTDKTNKVRTRMGEIEKKILLGLLASNESLSVLTLYSFSNGCPLGSYMSGDYAPAQWYQAVERLYRKGLIFPQEKKYLVLSPNGREMALRIFNELNNGIEPWLRYLITIEKRLKEDGVVS